MYCVNQLKKQGKKNAFIVCVSGVLLIAASCSHNESKSVPEVKVPEEVPFHADNDIAMTVRSIVDAIRVGEKLRPEDYDFEGVLTDGQGTPLYTDIEGGPGGWSVKVIGDSEAKIANLRLGDLMYADLRNYILSSLSMGEADLISVYENPENEGEIIYFYDTGEIDLKFCSIPAVTPSGLEGMIMAISISKKTEITPTHR